MTYLVLGIVFWFIGRLSSGAPSESDVEIIRKLSDGFVYLPGWLSWLCGRPHNKNLPQGVVATRALMSQLIGLLFLVYGYFDYTKRPIEGTNPESYILIMVLGIVLGYLLKRIMPYHP